MNITVGGPNDCPSYSTTIYNPSYQYQFPNWGARGWVCPKCGRVFSPTTPMCYYCGSNTRITPSTTTNPDITNIPTTKTVPAEWEKLLKYYLTCDKTPYDVRLDPNDHMFEVQFHNTVRY